MSHNFTARDATTDPFATRVGDERCARYTGNEVSNRDDEQAKTLRKIIAVLIVSGLFGMTAEANAEVSLEGVVVDGVVGIERGR